MKKLATEFGIKIVWFYGDPGHGRGLADAVSSFGWKQQLRHEIVTNDSWFRNAEEMVQFLTQYFPTDNSKEYHLVDAAETANIRANKRGEFELRPYRKFHVIAVNKDGIFSKMLYFTNPDTVTIIFYLNNDANHNGNTDKDADDDQIDESTFSLNQDTVCELVAPGTFVGMRSPHNAVGPFFIVEVVSKGTATEAISDVNGHTILCGEQYVEVCYLQKRDEKRNIVRYQPTKKFQSTYIHIAEIFVTNVALDAWKSMNINQY